MLEMPEIVISQASYSHHCMNCSLAGSLYYSVQPPTSCSSIHSSRVHLVPRLSQRPWLDTSAGERSSETQRTKMRATTSSALLVAPTTATMSRMVTSRWTMRSPRITIIKRSLLLLIWSNHRVASSLFLRPRLLVLNHLNLINNKLLQWVCTNQWLNHQPMVQIMQQLQHTKK